MVYIVHTTDNVSSNDGHHKPKKRMRRLETNSNVSNTGMPSILGLKIIYILFNMFQS